LAELGQSTGGCLAQAGLARSWAEQLGRAARPVAGGPSGWRPSGEEGEESERAAEERAENEEGEEIFIFLFIFQQIFPKAFSNYF